MWRIKKTFQFSTQLKAKGNAPPAQHERLPAAFDPTAAPDATGASINWNVSCETAEDVGNFKNAFWLSWLFWIAPFAPFCGFHEKSDGQMMNFLAMTIFI